jgi:hypothetical protein
MPSDQPLVTQDDIRRLEKQIAALQALLDRFGHDQGVQFTRIAQVQADIDLIRGAWTKVTAPADRAGQPYTGPERRQKPRKHR